MLEGPNTKERGGTKRRPIIKGVIDVITNKAYLEASADIQNTLFKDVEVIDI